MNKDKHRLTMMTVRGHDKAGKEHTEIRLIALPEPRPPAPRNRKERREQAALKKKAAKKAKPNKEKEND